MTSSPEYTSWRNMKQRCLNPNDKRYLRYGGRGITICQDWMLFDGFLADMGRRPDGTSLDRIDPNGNYEPSNCRWATSKEQMNNLAEQVKFDFEGEALTATQIAGRVGVKPGTVISRLQRGWEPVRAFKRRPESISSTAANLGMKAATLRSRLERGWDIRHATSMDDFTGNNQRHLLRDPHEFDDPAQSKCG